MILSIPFLASNPEQFDSTWLAEGFGVEASLFDREDIEDAETWDRVRATVREIASRYSPPAFTFHFPVNDCDYIADPAVRDRLFEAIDMVAENGLTGLVLHSNRIRTVDEWRALDVRRERARFGEFLRDLRARVADAPMWIGLENMPITGNDAMELDPLLVFPEDFAGLTDDKIGITWDFCHYSYSVHVARLLREGRLPDVNDYPNVRAADFLDFAGLADRIVHHHFSAFLGVATKPARSCVEGVPPWASTIPEHVYVEAFALIARLGARTVTLEIREDDYRTRSTVFEVAEWCRKVMATHPAG